MTAPPASPDPGPRPAFPEAARRHLREGRARLAAGERAEALALFRAAVTLDPAVLCAGWGLLPLLKAEGRASLPERMQARLQSWYRPPASPVHAHVAALTRKPEMRRFVSAFGLPLPRLLAEAPQIAALEWAALPDRVVLKPANGANSEGVIVAVDGVDRMTGERFGRDLASYATARHAALFERPPPVLAEEWLQDAGAPADPALVIPRDFKAFVAGGHVGFVRVLDRNAAGGRRGALSLDREGRPVTATLAGWPDAPQAPPPEGYGALVAMAERLSARLPWLLRLDFYLTPRGPVFGEVTTFPNAGLRYTPFARRTILQMWELWPD